MSILKVAQGVSGDDTTATVTIPHRVDRDEAVLQVHITDEATVVVEGKIDPDLPFLPVATFTESTLQPIAKLHQLRLVITDNTGQVHASLLF